MAGSNILFVHRLHPLVLNAEPWAGHRMQSEEAYFREITSKIHTKETISELSIIKHIFQFLLGSQMCCFLHQLSKRQTFLCQEEKYRDEKEKRNLKIWFFTLFWLTRNKWYLSQQWLATTSKTKWLLLPLLKKKKKKWWGYLVVLGYNQISLSISLQLRMLRWQVQIIKKLRWEFWKCTGRVMQFSFHLRLPLRTWVFFKYKS